MIWSQFSYTSSASIGRLYLVPTPIGNLDDITFRALETLKQVDYIAAEDTRHTKKLLHYFNIQKPLVSYYEHNKLQSGEKILRDLEEGKQVALVTDAGMPGISDPGSDLVQLALEKQIAVVSLPGANAALTALIASGVSTNQFLFVGFLDRHKKKKREQLEDLKKIPYTLIFYEAPHRIEDTLVAIRDVLGNRQIAVTREISKKHEEYIRGPVQEVLEHVQQNELRGEICLVVSGAHPDDVVPYGAENESWWADLSIPQHVEHYLGRDRSSKEAVKQVAKDRNIPKREVYHQYHIEE